MKKSPLSLILSLMSLIAPILMSAQSIRDVRINEIQLHNINGLKDEYGQAGSWIELYNNGYGKVNVGGCILKVKNNEYRIPRGEPSTVIPVQGFLVFYAAGTPDKGTLHTSLTLHDTDFIELYDTEGRLIDRLDFDPAEMPVDVSFGWAEDHDGKEKAMILPATTPGSNNNTIEKISRAELFRQADPLGLVLTITSILVVSVALTALFLIFKFMDNFHVNLALKQAAKISANGKHIGGMINGAITNDELAAIALTLYKYYENVHDQEKMVLTINRTSKIYSPWNSKIYGLTRTRFFNRS